MRDTRVKIENTLTSNSSIRRLEGSRATAPNPAPRGCARENANRRGVSKEGITGKNSEKSARYSIYFVPDMYSAEFLRNSGLILHLHLSSSRCKTGCPFFGLSTVYIFGSGFGIWYSKLNGRLTF